MRKKRIAAVYIIKNKLSGACYVGFSRNWIERKQYHIYSTRSDPFKKTCFNSEIRFDLSFYGRRHFNIRKIKQYPADDLMSGWAHERAITQELDRKGVPLYNIANTSRIIPIIEQSIPKRRKSFNEHLILRRQWR